MEEKALFGASLDQFAQSVWGQPNALRKQPFPGTEVIDLGEYFSAIEWLFAGLLMGERILITAEYRAAVAALQTERYERGACILGQPGIGKTYFLAYALLYFLGQKQPVAFQPLSGQSMYVLFKGTGAAWHVLDDRSPLYACGFVWALSDSNADIIQPPPAFRIRPGRIRVVQTTSPQLVRWKEWSKQSRIRRYVMDIWTKEEIAILAELLGLDATRAVSLAEKWGNVPRTLLDYFSEEDQSIETRYRDLAEHAIVECPAIVNSGKQFNYIGGPSPFYVLRPQKIDTRAIDRTSSCVDVPTETLRRILAESLQGQTNATKIAFYHTLSAHAITRQAAGSIFECWFHSFFCRKGVIRCEWDDHTSQLPTTLQGTSNIIPATKTTLKVSAPPFYWIPPYSNFPGIDSALVLNDAIYAFQVTISSTHKSPLRGLERLYGSKDFPADLKTLPWRMVFVGAGEQQIKSVAEEHVGKLCLPKHRMHIPVAWAVVDPAVEGVTYQTFHDEVGAASEELDVEIVGAEGEPAASMSSGN